MGFEGTVEIRDVVFRGTEIQGYFIERVPRPLEGSGFRGLGSGFRVSCAGFRVSDLRGAIEGFRMRVEGVSDRLDKFKHENPTPSHLTCHDRAGFVFRVSGVGFRVSTFRSVSSAGRSGSEAGSSVRLTDFCITQL